MPAKKPQVPSKPEKPLTYSRIQAEITQHHTVRRSLYRDLEEKLGAGKRVVAFFTSFVWDVAIEDRDAEMLEEVLQNTDLTGKELVLLLNSPGGDGLTAERIVNICRSYSPGGFCVIVPKMAKSAATMVCMGASKIVMSKTSELGPVDPQIPFREADGRIRYRPAHEVIESYEGLLRKASGTKGRIEPYLQQLQRFDARDIRGIRSAQVLSEKISIGLLQSGALSGKRVSYIRKKIDPFLNPRSTVVHGRPIYADVAKNCGLNVEVAQLGSSLWRAVWKLYVRLDYCITGLDGSKIIESSEDSFLAPIPRRSGA